MAERTYRGKTLEGWLSLSKDACYGKHIIEELGIHIRELQAENEKLKAEWREFGIRCMKALAFKMDQKRGMKAEIEAIVEQELSK